VSTAEHDGVVFMFLLTVSLRWTAGQTVCVVGAVGSGKTTLLLGVVRALAPVAGVMRVVGDCAFVPQVCVTGVSDAHVY
jgi:ABC-type cobalamin/Fe3+-siderophores transport system ATPase subunit